MQPRQPEQPRRITAADIEKRRALRRKKQRQKRLRATLLLVLAVVLIVGVKAFGSYLNGIFNGFVGKIA